MWAQTLQERGVLRAAEGSGWVRRGQGGVAEPPLPSPALEILQDVGHDVKLGFLVRGAQEAAWSSQLLEWLPQRPQQNAWGGGYREVGTPIILTDPFSSPACGPSLPRQG